MSDGEDETRVHTGVQTGGGGALGRKRSPQVEIAAELGLQPSQLRRWQKAVHGTSQRPTAPAAGAAPVVPAPADLAAENARLRRELERARAERDILKKAIGIFSETPR